MKMGNLDTDTQGEQTPCEDEGRDGDDVAEVRNSRDWVLAKQSELGERHGADPPWQPPEEISAANSFILDSSLYNSETVSFCFCSHLDCGTLLH